MPSELNIASQYTAHISRAPSQPRVDHGDQSRPSLPVKLRTFLKAPELDEVLAGGADPGGSDELLLRARQLGRNGR